MKIIREKTPCDICQCEYALVDGKTRMGHWAFMCNYCHLLNGVGIGTGKGQYIYVRETKHVLQQAL